MLSSITSTSIDFGRNTTVPRHVDESDKAPQDKVRKTHSTEDNASFSPQEQREIEQLKARDQEVRVHEQAHLSAAGGIALSGASFTFATGPDGQRYAIGGEVSIDVSEVPGDPQATIRKAELIRKAALAPLNPSSQDHKVAGKAAQMSNKAHAELLQQQKVEDNEDNKGSHFDLTV